MRLKQLKLTGFKSFVEPTSIPFPSQLVAVVGPNGCGKSNIMDAVRWAMGESSAKNLRGDSMVDVIFNGSSNRKPLGQASVELQFDNSLGRISGQYAAYQDVSIKRKVTRDGDSSYFLNGTKCRRRDINDVFLGTGSGARGYAIIGQEMISRIIESRPEELRQFFEEAAGVSKYKERRRLTLQKIKQTQENLERVDDILKELGQQLSRLERQAKTAERYKLLKQQEREYQAALLAMKWFLTEEERISVCRNICTAQRVFEKQQSQLAAHQKEQVSLQESIHQGHEALQAEQKYFYELSNEVNQLEKANMLRQEEKIRLSEELAQLTSEIENLETEITQEDILLTQLNENIVKQEKVQASLKQTFELKREALAEKQTFFSKWQENWLTLQKEKNNVSYELKSEKIKREALQVNREKIELAMEKLHMELSEHNLETLCEQADKAHKDESHWQDQLSIACEHEERLNRNIRELKQELAESEQKIRHAQKAMQELAIKKAEVLASLNTILKMNSQLQELADWKEHPRIMDNLSVDTAWLPACELVLGDYLHGVVVDSIDEVLPKISTLEGRQGLFVTRDTREFTLKEKPRLIDKIEGELPCNSKALEHIYAAESLEQAIEWLPMLEKEQSIVTVDGHWLGHGWLKILGKIDNNEQGGLAKKQALVKLEKQLTQAKVELQGRELVYETQFERLQGLERDSGKLKEEQAQIRQALQESQMIRQEKTLALNKAENFSQQSQYQQVDFQDRLESTIEEISEVEVKIESLLSIQDKLDKNHLLLIEEKNELEKELTFFEQEVEQSREFLHQDELKLSRDRQQKMQAQENLIKNDAGLKKYQGKQVQLSQRLMEVSSPENKVSPEIDAMREQLHTLEQTLSEYQSLQSERQTKMIEIQTVRREVEAQSKQAQEQLNDLKMQEQALSIQCTSVDESLKALDADRALLLKTLNTNESLEQREKELQQLQDKINRLGAINLLAIEEYQSEQQRKQYLDTQHGDLTESLGLLEQAITKMDQETMARLKETFDDVNQAFQQLFPRLFGGGRAKLEQTCDNLLEAGVVVHAQPPGKRNSTIQMLSGGEKAMTAVALIFAIFQLNPAPFCLLDEVDAPLDDANVRRFCELVKEMSACVQFLFITHNKVTMELADHLIGVTMREPGVSRVVAVDVEHALKYAE